MCYLLFFCTFLLVACSTGNWKCKCQSNTWLGTCVVFVENDNMWQFLTCALLCIATVNPQTKDEAVELATGIMEAVSDKSPGDVGLFVPFPFIETVQDIAGDKFVVGAEVRICRLFACTIGNVRPY